MFPYATYLRLGTEPWLTHKEFICHHLALL